MEELKVTPADLKGIIECGRIVGSGEFGIVFTYKDRLIKLDRYLYEVIKNYTGRNINYELDKYYEYETRKFFDPEQIQELSDKQKNVTLTKLPEGILSFKEVSPQVAKFTPGIIIPYHRDHKKLEELDPRDQKTVLIILKKLLLIVEELADNRISQEDMVQYNDFDIQKRNYNILYKDTTPQMIDMSGYFVKVGNHFYDAKNMYRELGNMILDFFVLGGIKAPTYSVRENITTYEENERLIMDYEEKTRRL